MSRFRLILLLSPLCLVLFACPYESKVPMEPGPVEKIDSSLLGYWYGIVKDGSDFFGIEALEISQKSDSIYSIIRYGKAAKGDIILPDTSYFTAYVSYIGEQRFMNVEGGLVTVKTRKNKAPEVITEKIYYLSAFSTRNDTMVMKTVTENFSSNKLGFRRSEDYKAAVTELLGQQKNIYDDLYALSYHKIQKPVPIKPF